MKNASSSERLSSTTGNDNGGSSPTDFARRVKNLFTGSSPLYKKRSMSLDALDSKPAVSQMFGVPLTDLCKREGTNVPFIVRTIVGHIEEEGLDHEGIYRINGNAKVIERLKADFNRDGNADFTDIEIPAISSLLKLFLRELPGGIVPEDFVPHFARIQQCYPSEATPEALDKLKDSLRLLPTTNYNMLSYLIQHLTRVAKQSDKNKMTAVSLSIVFGPNIFPCGSGIEALKLQGYSNATTCRLIQNYRTLFDRRRGQKLEPPEKPQPYAEHKRQKKETASPEPKETATGSSHDLECSHSERSIDEAIEKSSGALSPTSPTPITNEETKPKATPLHQPPPPLVVEPYKAERENAKPRKYYLGRSKSLDKSSLDEAEVGGPESRGDQSFHRQYAKRGMKFKARHSISEGTLNKPPTSGGDQVLRHPHLNAINSREDELMRTPSPYSWQSSPGTSPPTSPALTPRSSKVVSLMIEDTVKNFLFQSSSTSTTANGKCDESTTGEDKTLDPKADVYGLLLPASVKRRDPSKPISAKKKEQSKLALTKKEEQPKPVLVKKEENSKTAPVKDKEHSEPAVGGSVQLRKGAGEKGVTMRQHSKKLRNRTSAVYGPDVDETITNAEAETAADDAATSPIQNMSVKLVSLSPESSFNNGEELPDGVIETRQGKVSDLVKQFEDEERADQKEPVGTGRDSAADVSEVGGQKVKKKKPANKAFDMFEKSGIIMGMGGPPSVSNPRLPSVSNPRVVSFASEVSTILTPSITDNGNCSVRATLTTVGSTIAGSEDFTAISKDFLSVSTCDEDVFTSPSHSVGTNSSSTSPNHGKFGHRGQLGTSTSDDVFISPVHVVVAASKAANESTDGSCCDDLDEVKRSESTLEHLTLSRPKGPAARKRPRRTSAPPSCNPVTSPLLKSDASSNTSVDITDHGAKLGVKVVIDNEQRKDIERPPNETLRSTVNVSQEDDKEKLTDIAAGTLVLQEKHREKAREERTRVKSAPETSVPSTEDKKPEILEILANGEDESDKREYEKRKSSQDGRKRSSLNKGNSTTTARHRKKRHTVSNIEQLKITTPSSGETSHEGVPSVISRMPLVDLTALAPERQQAVNQVTEGWKEGNTNQNSDNTLPAAPTTIREIVQKIHEFKSQLRKFEDDFVAEHGHKPSSAEKMPVRTLLEELNRLRKLYKELKEKEKISEESAKDKAAHANKIVAEMSPGPPPLEVAIGRGCEAAPKIRSQSFPTLKDEHGSIDRSQATTNVTSAADSVPVPPNNRELSSLSERGSKSSLQQTLEKIMAGLDARRKLSGRPDDPMLMTKEQALEEKQLIQKALLSFEKTHGRPQTKLEKQTMKPLYDKYRQIKKICSGDFRKESEGSVSVVSPRESLAGLESTSDSLPSVTLLQSGMAKSLPSGPPGYVEPDEPLSRSAVELLRSTSTSRSMLTTVTVTPGPRGSQPTEQLMNEKQLQAASVDVVRHQKELFLSRKKELRTILKDFELAFMGLHGRSVSRADRKPMQSEYDEYKSIKTRLLTINGLLREPDHPQKTI